MSADTTALKDGADFRLPDDVKPTHYEVTIKSDLEKLTFEGTAIVELEIVKETSTITFNALKPLQIQKAIILSTSLKQSSSQSSTTLSVDEKLERCSAKFPTSLPSGSTAKLALRFTGEMDESMMGYYRGSGVDKDGKKKNYALTQFEPTAARRAFPCWDEPGIKATFDLRLVSRKGSVSLANTPVVREKTSSGTLSLGSSFGEEDDKADKEEGGDWVVSTFERTPKMSTYLIAWANGNFEFHEASYKSPLTGREVPMRVYTTHEYIHQAKLALEIKTKILPIYEKARPQKGHLPPPPAPQAIFDIAYPLGKLDTLVASDFDAGAMENWGLITGRTSVYLYDEEKSGLSVKKTVVGVQSHEVAHQWFGNVVTMEWWDNLWLNEAFATLMGEVIIVNEVYPEWRVHSDFILRHLKRALSLDAQRSSHPIEMPCPDSAMINQIFDAISYSKGASVLKMLSFLVGEKVFLEGVSIYLKNHLYGNSRTADLWAGISQSSGLDVAKIMKEWTLVKGFPIVSVEETAEGLKVKQNRFLSTGDPTPEEDQTIWYIPLQLKTIGADTKPKIDSKAILAGRETTLPLKDVKDGFYKLNAETAGVYRVRYSPERLTKLGDEASKPNSALSLNDRMGLVQDAVVLAKSGYAQTSAALNLISKLKGETENLVWGEIASGLGDLSNTWWEQPEPVRKAIDELNSQLFGPLVDKLGFDGSKSDSPDVTELRVTAVGAAAQASNEKVLAEIKRRYGILVDQNDDSAIPGDLRRIIFSSAVKHGGEKEYEKALDVYRNPQTPHHQIAAMLALTATRDPKLIQRTFDFVGTEEVKQQDVMYFFLGLASNEKTRRDVYKYTQENLDKLTQRFKGNFSLGRIVQYSFDSFSTYEDAKAVEEFFKDKDTSTYNQALQQGLDAVRAKAGWIKRDAGDVESWFKAHGYLA